jgi:hypothetical protein
MRVGVELRRGCGLIPIVGEKISTEDMGAFIGDSESLIVKITLQGGKENAATRVIRYPHTCVNRFYTSFFI